MKKIVILPLVIVLLFTACRGDIPKERLSKIQEKLDQIVAKMESGKGLKAKDNIGDIQKEIKSLKEEIDDLQREVDSIKKQLEGVNLKSKSRD